MTHEQILKTAREILFQPTCDPERGCSCCSPDDVGMFEYLDGAIGELVAEEVTKAQDQVVHLYSCGCENPRGLGCDQK